MAISKEKKAKITDKAKDILKNSTGVVFVNFHKLTVKGVGNLRTALREQGVGYTVVKKTLLKRALAEASVTGELPPLRGELAVAYGADPIAPARGIREFADKNPDVLSIMGGIFEGRFMGEAEMKGVSLIPSRQVLLAQFVNLINSPIQRFAVALGEVAKQKA